MFSVNGFYGHIQQNHMRSLAMFAGFAVAFQIAAGALLTLPIIFSGSTNFIFVAPFEYLKEYGLPVFLVSMILFCVRYVYHVRSLRKSMNLDTISRRSNPRLYSIVEVQATTAGIPMPEVAIMPEAALNAFACGLTKNSSTVVVTEGLLSALDDDELSAVIAHEVVHIKYGDVATMAVANASLGTISMIERYNPIKVRGWKTTVLVVLFPPFLFLAMFYGLAMSIAMTTSMIARLLIASSRELIADAEAVRLTHNPSALISALAKIEGRSSITDLDPMTDAMMIDGAVEGQYASHPTIAERIAVLTQHAGSMVQGVGARRDTRAGSAARHSVGLANPSAPSFGRRQNIMPSLKSASSAFNRETPKPEKKEREFLRTKILPGSDLINRVNRGSGKNAFGLTAGARKGILIGFGIFIAIQIFSTMSIMNQMESVNSKLSTPAKSSNSDVKNLDYFGSKKLGE